MKTNDLSLLLLQTSNTHSLSSALKFQKWRETFPLWGTDGHFWTLSEIAVYDETWPNHFLLCVFPMILGRHYRRLMRYLLQYEKHKVTSFLLAVRWLESLLHILLLFHYSLIALFLVLRSCFLNQNKSKPLSSPALLVSHSILFTCIQSYSQTFLECCIDYKARISSVA